MRSVFPVLSLLAVAVSAAPLTFEGHLLEHGDVNGRVAVLHHVTHHGAALVGTAGVKPVLRLLHLVPTLHKVHTLTTDGFACKHFTDVKPLPFLGLTGNDLLVDLVGVADCKTWFGALVHVWDHAAGVDVYRGHAGHKALGDARFTLHALDLPGLVDFVRGKADAALLGGLLAKGVPAHLLTHRLHAAVAHLL